MTSESTDDNDSIAQVVKPRSDMQGLSALIYWQTEKSINFFKALQQALLQQQLANSKSGEKTSQVTELTKFKFVSLLD